MPEELEVRPEAQDDIEAAALWYEARREGLGERFVSEVDALMDRGRVVSLEVCMSQLKQVEAEARKLPADERARLAHRLLESIDEASDADVE